MTPLRAKLKELGFDRYDDYLSSRHWKDVKESYRRSGLPLECRCCRHSNYELHHITYENLGDEGLADLVPLCGDCHLKVHHAHRKYGIALADINEAIKAVRDGEEYAPVWKTKLTRKNSTKKQRKRRKKEREAIRQKAHGLSGQVLIQCPSCHRRGWQDGPFCCNCGTKGEVIKRNP